MRCEPAANATCQTAIRTPLVRIRFATMTGFKHITSVVWSVVATLLLICPTYGENASPELPFYPLYRIPVRIHLGQSALSVDELLIYLAEVNLVWRDQAAICFEFAIRWDDQRGRDGFDIFFKPELEDYPGYSTISGLHRGDHDIQVRDIPDLYDQPPAVVSGGARTTAHELGHALGLSHNEYSNDFLMRSGYQGIDLQPHEIRIAREHAAKKSLSNTDLIQCNAPTVGLSADATPR